MLIIVDASFREGKREILEGYPLEAMPKVEHLTLEGEGELLVQLIRDEKVSLEELQNGALYIFDITDRNRSSLGYFGSVFYLK